MIRDVNLKQRISCSTVENTLLIPEIDIILLSRHQLQLQADPRANAATPSTQTLSVYSNQV